MHVTQFKVTTRGVIWAGPERRGEKSFKQSQSLYTASSFCQTCSGKKIIWGKYFFFSVVISGEWYWYLCPCLFRCGVFFVFFHNNDPTLPDARSLSKTISSLQSISPVCPGLTNYPWLVTDRQHRWSHSHLSESVLMYSPMWTTEKLYISSQCF